MYIQFIKTSNCQYAHINDVIIVMIKEAVQNSPLEWSEVIGVVIVHTYKELKCDNGMIVWYDNNAIIVIDQDRNPKGTWIFGAIAGELRWLNFIKLVLLAPKVL